MPLYQFRCKDCGVLFDQQVEQSDSPLSCPHCKSNSVKKLFMVNIAPPEDDDNENADPC